MSKYYKILTLDKFTLEYKKSKDFINFSFGPKRFYLIWVSFWAVYHLIWVALDWYWWQMKEPYKGPWIMFLTNQSYLIMTVVAFLDFIIGFYVHCSRPDILKGESWKTLPWYMKIFWVLFNISNAGSILITVGYWTMLRKSTHASTLNKHGINCIYTISSLLLTSKPVRFQHAYIPVIYNFFFILFTVILDLAGGRVIYSFLNWGKKPGFAAMLSVLYILILVPLAHFLMYGVYRLKIFIYQKFYLKNVDQNQNEKENEEEGTMMTKRKEKQKESQRNIPHIISQPSFSDIMDSEAPMLPENV